MAHQQHRRGDAHLKNNKLDEAIECHDNAAELLLDAMKSTTSSVAFESLTLQHSYILKQIELIKRKREQCTRVRKSMDEIKCLSKEPPSDNQGHYNTKIQIALYRAINETDSLLLTLKNKPNDTEKDSKQETIIKDVTDGKKTEKTQETVVEELQILTQSLHSLVEQLVFQIEILKDENMLLNDKVNFLENEREKYINFSTSTNDLTNNFSTLTIGNEAMSVDNILRPIAPNQDKPVSSLIAMDETGPPTHFDLSTSKDD